jgi:hypothetical protein
LGLHIQGFHLIMRPGKEVDEREDKASEDEVLSLPVSSPVEGETVNYSSHQKQFEQQQQQQPQPQQQQDYAPSAWGASAGKSIMSSLHAAKAAASAAHDQTLSAADNVAAPPPSNTGQYTAYGSAPGIASEPKSGSDVDAMQVGTRVRQLRCLLLSCAYAKAFMNELVSLRAYEAAGLRSFSSCNTRQEFVGNQMQASKLGGPQ